MKRRTFLYNTTMATGAVFAAPNVFGFKGSPGEKVVVGVMGTNGRGEYLATLYSSLDDVEVGFICDVDDTVLQRTINKIKGLTGKAPKGYKDVRKMLEEKDLDALVVAAPDHWHAPASLMALKAGKHVYVEKPCCHSPAEGEILIEAATKYNKLVQMGNQRRSWPGVGEAIKELQSGTIGRVYYAKGWYSNARKPIGIGKAVSAPANLDYELWQGPAPRRPYKDNLIHYNWHWFWNWGTGEACNNGTHEIDVMRWGLGVGLPKRVTSGGGRFAYKDDWETPDTQVITYEFDNNTSISWEGRSCNQFDETKGGRGTIFYGDKGTLIMLAGDDYKVYDLGNKLIKDAKSPLGQVEASTTGMGDKLDATHLNNFCDSIRGKAKLNSPISDAYKSTLLPHLGNIAQRTGKTLNCNTANGHCDDADAKKLWSREYEKGWEMKL
ncbi:MAG TPA: Gfo/Idh/MocA family oxidoreductase [Cyclobacteriaceae bacterium]|nr:Gfo/Idh/MocA family oxidoreductase [Cyclobacteriaceae bacterium]